MKMSIFIHSSEMLKKTSTETLIALKQYTINIKDNIKTNFPKYKLYVAAIKAIEMELNTRN